MENRCKFCENVIPEDHYVLIRQNSICRICKDEILRQVNQKRVWNLQNSTKNNFICLFCFDKASFIDINQYPFEYICKTCANGNNDNIPIKWAALINSLKETTGHFTKRDFIDNYKRLSQEIKESGSIYNNRKALLDKYNNEFAKKIKANITSNYDLIESFHQNIHHQIENVFHQKYQELLIFESQINNIINSTGNFQVTFGVKKILSLQENEVGLTQQFADIDDIFSCISNVIELKLDFLNTILLEENNLDDSVHTEDGK